MTHTLHRRPEHKVEGEDFTILCMAAQGYNDHGAGEKLEEIYKLVASTSPDNLADDNLGGRFTGHTDAEILDHMGDKAYIGAAYKDRTRLKAALEKIKAADLGISVVVTGKHEAVFQIWKVIRRASTRNSARNATIVFGSTSVPLMPLFKMSSSGRERSEISLATPFPCLKKPACREGVRKNRKPTM